ncbi:hypothetical protein B566_EDAN013348, partial [Ephemera danica]
MSLISFKSFHINSLKVGPDTMHLPLQTQNFQSYSLIQKRAFHNDCYLKNLGVDDSGLSWIKPYLTGRKQQFEITTINNDGLKSK